MLQTIGGILQLIILTIFIIQYPASSSSITTRFSGGTAVPPTPTAPQLPYCQNNSETPYICGDKCLISIPESDSIAFFESFNFPLFLTDHGTFCNLNFVLNSTQSRSVSTYFLGPPSRKGTSSEFFGDEGFSAENSGKSFPERS